MNEIIQENNAPSAPNDTIVTTEQAPLFSRPEVITAVMMLALGYLAVKLVLAPLSHDNAGLGITLFTLLFMGAVLYWQRGQQQRLSKDSWAYLVLILLTAVYFTLYDNLTLKALALLLLPLLVAYFTATVSGTRLEERLSSYLPYELLSALIARPLYNLFSGPRALFSGIKNTKNTHNLLLLLLGMVLAIPACFLVSYMLQEADAAFSALWQRLTGAFLTESIITNIFQFILSLPLACYFFALLYGGKKPRQEVEKVNQLAVKARFVPGMLAIGGITPLLFIYAVFFFSQTAYFLSAFNGLLPEGYIYSEYARRGFFELCRVSGLNFMIILLLLLFCKKGAGKGSVYRLYAVALSLCSIALIIISLSKMLLYIQIYGLTPLRVYTSWFMLLLALIFIFIIIRVYRPRFNIIKWSSIIAVAMFLLLCFANPDSVIARYNVNGYMEGRLEHLDVQLFEDLGDAAIPYLMQVRSMEQASEEDKAEALRILYERYEEQRPDWRGFNFTSQNANRLLKNIV